MQLVDAVVKFPGGQPRVGQSGRPYVSALFTTSGGEELRVFAPPEGAVTEALQQLQPGQSARLAIDSRGRAHYCVPDQQQAQPMGFAPTPQPVAPQPQVQQQAPAYQAQPQAPVAAPAGGGEQPPILAMAAQWAAAFRALTAAGVPAEQAGAGASCCLIQANGRR